MAEIKKYQWRKEHIPGGGLQFNKHEVEFYSLFNNLDSLYSLFPYPLKRIFCTLSHKKAKEDVRGMHAHYKTFELMIVLRGSVRLQLDNCIKKETILLNQNDSVLIGPNVWRVLDKYSEDNVNIFFCSTIHDNDDYINKFDDFKEYMLLNDHCI